MPGRSCINPSPIMAVCGASDRRQTAPCQLPMIEAGLEHDGKMTTPKEPWAEPLKTALGGANPSGAYLMRTAAGTMPKTATSRP